MISSAISGFPLSRVSSLRLLWRAAGLPFAYILKPQRSPIAFRAFRPNFRTLTA